MSSSVSSIVRFDNVSKRYTLGRWLPGPLQGVFRSLEVRKANDFWALHDVSFAVASGEVLGIIGANGSGKSTCLKILAGVTRPTRGRVVRDGRLSALIELGAGFHPELTGRDNIYLNSAILGMKRCSIDAVLDDIIAFAELERFIDTPVKRYSSGMYARLGFSIAVHVNPDILLVDEVLSVGDLAFQQKSLQKMLEFKERAKAMIFVSHNMVAVERLCNRVVWLDAGKVQIEGRPDEVIAQYRKRSAGRLLATQGKQSMSLGDYQEIQTTIESVELLDQKPQQAYKAGDALRVKVSFKAERAVREFACAIALYSVDGMKLGETSNLWEGIIDNIEPQESGAFVAEICVPPLISGVYYFNVALSDGYMIMLDHITRAVEFEIVNSKINPNDTGPLQLYAKWYI